MKKKILSLLLLVCLLVPCSLVLTGCKDKEPDKFATFTELGAGDTLFVGQSAKFKNYRSADVEDYYLTYPALAIASLARTTSSSYSYDSVYYNGYYYYWNIEKTNENLLLGQKTTVTSKSYSYMIYGKDNTNIVVKTTTKIETTYNFKCGMIEKPCEVVFDLNGYFGSVSDLKTKSLDLYNKVQVSDTTKHYIAAPKTTYSHSENTYNDTYFYLG